MLRTLTVTTQSIECKRYHLVENDDLIQLQSGVNGPQQLYFITKYGFRTVYKKLQPSKMCLVYL